MSDLIERLRGNQCPPNHGCGVMPSCACGDMIDAADEIERLRAALKPFADVANHYTAIIGDDHELCVYAAAHYTRTPEKNFRKALTVGHCRAARAALEPKP